MPQDDEKNKQQNEQEEQQTQSLEISPDNIRDDGSDDSEAIILEIQKAKLELLREIYEIEGENLGDKDASVEYRNYLVNNPIILGGGNGIDGLINIDLSNYQGGIITIDKLMQIFPNANRDIAAGCLAALDYYGNSVGLNDKGKLMVLAQMGVECGFRTMTEYGKGKGRKYGVPTGPYNKIYYGRGPIQITWDYNYKKITEEVFPQMGISADIYANPDLCEENILLGCAASLGWFMLPGNGKRAVQCANNGDVVGLSVAINGGTTHLEKRKNYTQQIFNNV